MSKEQTTVYIERKPTMNYGLAVITSFNSSDTTQVTLTARGARVITTAVDVAERVNHRFMNELSIGKIRIGTEAIQGEDGTRNGSTMKIAFTQWR